MNIDSIEIKGLIKKIKRKRIISILLFAACLAGVILSAPWYLEILDEVIINNDGSMTLVFIFGFSAFICLFGYVLASVPIYNALLHECDAKKHLIMLTALEKEKNIYPMLSDAYFYTGDFATAIYYDKMVYEKKSHYTKLTALFKRARSEYFSDKIDDFICTASDFNSLLACAKLSERQRKTASKFQAVINLLSAIINKDTGKIKEYASKLQAWEETKITGSLINCLKGLAAYTVEDKAEATYRFMAVADTASKTALGTLAKEYLEKLNSETNIKKEEN